MLKDVYKGRKAAVNDGAVLSDAAARSASANSTGNSTANSTGNSTAASNSTSLRRRPRQVRSQERINRILDTAEQVFAEIGYDAATTNLIASQAETSIGSLYEFFPNKEAIAQALAERYLEQIDSLYANLFEVAAEMEGPQVVERIVDGLDRFYREHPGAIPLLNGQLSSPELAAAGASLQLALERRIESIVAMRRPDFPQAKCHLISVVIGSATRALLVRADQVPLSQRRALVREIDALVVGYLRQVGETFDALN
jgi:AcrR family transcriptional regulator